MKKFLLVIAGPTASGKTDLAIRLAIHFHTEIISADSRQFFREMEIGTAKPTPSQLRSVPHHFINSHAISQNYNAGLFEADCNNLINDLFEKYNLLILTGGSGLYIDAVIKGIDDLPAADLSIRELLEDEYREKGIRYLQAKLSNLDPVTAQKIDLANPRRLMRALEVCMVTGKPYAELLRKKKNDINYNVIFLGTEIPRQELYDRINNRVDEMIKAGLKDEVRKLLPYKNQPAMQTVGYKELVAFYEDKCSEKEAIEKIKQHTRNYAKRQLTWFKKNKDVHWVDPADVENIIAYIEQQVK